MGIQFPPVMGVRGTRPQQAPNLPRRGDPSHLSLTPIGPHPRDGDTSGMEGQSCCPT